MVLSYFRALSMATSSAQAAGIMTPRDVKFNTSGMNLAPGFKYFDTKLSPQA
jgi:hypothetical protein